MAVKEGNRNRIIQLVKSGSDPNDEDDRGRSALMYAAASAKPDMVALLLKAGADPNHESYNWGETPLDWAKSRKEDKDKRKIVQLLQAAMNRRN